MTSVSSTSSSTGTSTTPTSASTATSTIVSQLIASTSTSSGLDDTTIINELVAAESTGLTTLQNKDAAVKTQISLVANIASELQTFQNTAATLQTNGLVAIAPTSTPPGLTATAGSGAKAGRYSIQVDALAQAAKDRSQAFGGTSATVAGGTMSLSVMGTSYSLNITDGSSLSDVADAISNSGAPVSAVVLNDGTNSYLSVTNTNTGYPIGGSPSDALSITMTTTGTGGTALNLTPSSAAQNASFTVDGLQMTRTSNTVTDAIPNVTMSLTSTTTQPSDLVLGTDNTTTAANLQAFVDAYNKVMSDVQSQLNVQSGTDRTQTLAGNSAVESLETQLQGLISMPVGSGTYTTLADLGVSTQEDGSLVINTSVLNNALATDPESVNNIFGSTVTGIGWQAQDLADRFNNPVDGLLTNTTTQMNSQVTDLENQETQEQSRLDAYKATLQEQYSNMESIVSSLKTVGQYLTQQDAQNNKSG